MRILHTSDWHVGRTFHSYNTLEAVSQVLAQIPVLIEKHKIDVVVVAGDIYDLANPTPDAVNVLRDAVTAILKTGAKMVMISGNHDSATRLSFAGAFSAPSGLYIVTQAEEALKPIELSDEFGPVDFYGIPFLQPELVRHLDWVASDANSQHQVIGGAMTQIRKLIDQRKSESRRSVVVAHTFVAGGETETSDSERAITMKPLEVGGVDVVPKDVFAGATYAALGHIHGRKELEPHLRYSGALMHYSFKEADKPRGGWLVELNEDGLGQVEWLDLPVIRPLAEIRGTFEELLTKPEFAKYAKYFVRAIYTDQTRQIDAMVKLKTRFEFCAEVLNVPGVQIAGNEMSYRERVKGKTDLEIIEGFLVDVRNGDGASPEESDLIKQVITASSASEA
jgi:exonuclease SbcD